MARPINIAFEGGGARLVTLIAAAHAVSELEHEGQLHLLAVSGSSAGALAAFLLGLEIDGGKVDFENVKKALKRRDGAIQQNFPNMGKFRLYWRGLLFYLFGYPIFSPQKFNDIVSSVLEHVNVDTKKSLSEYARAARSILLSLTFTNISLWRVTPKSP